MLSYDFEQSVGFWLTTAHQAYMRRFQELLAPYGITYRQAQVLGWIAAEGPMSQAELAARTMVEPPTLVGVLNRMEQHGFIERREHPVDRRKKLIHPLPAASELWGYFVECGRQVREEAVRGMSEEERDNLIHLLRKIRENVATQELEEAK